jgi:hypothetical protein
MQIQNMITKNADAEYDNLPINMRKPVSRKIAQSKVRKGTSWNIRNSHLLGIYFGQA